MIENEIFDTAYNAGYTNGVREFAEYLKQYAENAMRVGYDGMGAEDIEDKLKEFLEERK